MGVFSRNRLGASGSPSPPASGQSAGKDEASPKPAISHTGDVAPARRAPWRLPRAGDGDTAMALISEHEEIGEVVDPKEETRLERKIDFMILPYLAVYDS